MCEYERKKGSEPRVCFGISNTKPTVGISLQKLLLYTLLVFLLLPPATLQFFQDSGTKDVDVSSSDVGGANEAIKQVAKRRPFEKKFKFRKLERISIEEDDDNSDVDAEGESAGAGASASAGDNGSDVNADISAEAVVDDVSAAASDHLNDADELQFVRARKAHKERPTTTATPATATATTTANADKNVKKKKPVTVKKLKGTPADNNKSTESFFGTLFGGLWTGGDDKQPSKASNDRSRNSGESKEKQQEQPAAAPSNSIIDWLKWLGEKSSQWRQPAPTPAPAPAPTPAPVAASFWLAYLNRWPFNSFFPIGKPAKPVRMPRRAANPIKSAENLNSAEAASIMSQEHFESVLHTLPGFVTNPGQVTQHTECRQQLQIFHRQLRGNKLWTLQMLDATGKITAGLLRGNINQFGDFELCTQVKTLVKVTPEIPLRVRGKYCLAHIEMQTAVPALKVPLHLVRGRGLWNSHLGNPSHFVPRYGVANWGVCIPHLCPAKVVREMIETNLRPYNSTGIEFHVEVNDADCYLRQSKKFTKLLQKDEKFAIACGYIAALMLLGFIALCCQYWTTMKSYLGNKTQAEPSTDNESNNAAANVESDEPTTLEVSATAVVEEAADADPAVEQEIEQTAAHLPLKTLLLEIFKSFSPQRTLSELLAPDHFVQQFPLLHLLKLGATFALYVCLKYLMIGHLPITNRDKLVRAIDQPTSILFRSPMLYTDVLLVVGGFLGAYQLSAEMEQKSHIQLLKRIALKVSRYLPTLYLVLFFQTWILPHLGSGPLWTNLIGQNARICEQQMWRNVFSVQNAIDFEETCSPMTVQLALDVQLYLLGPLIVWLYYTDADAALFVYGAIHVMSVGARFARTQREYLSMTLFHGMNVSKFYRTANLLYSSPITRATPYLLGIGAGMLHRTQAGTLEIAAEHVPIGWLMVALSVVWCYWSPSAGMRMDFVYSSSEAAAYAAWCPLIVGLCVVWCIFMFPKGEGSVMRFLTTTRPVLFLSRIVYPMQLMMYVVVMYNTARVSEARKYHLSDLVNFNEIGAIVLFAIVLAFIIDIPAKRIRRLIIDRLFVERPQQETEPEPSSGAEASEPELEEPSEQTTSEATDTAELEQLHEKDKEWNTDTDTEAAESVFNEDKQTQKDHENTTVVENGTSTDLTETEADEESEAAEETDIAEEDEIMKRPGTPPTKEKTDEPAYRWRQRRISED